MKILIVDKSEKDVSMIHREYTKLDQQCEGNWTGSEGLVRSRVFHPDLIVVGDLPDMKEWWFDYRFLREHNAAYQRPFLVNFTRNPSRRKKALCLECGFDISTGAPFAVGDIVEWADLAQRTVP